MNYNQSGQTPSGGIWLPWRDYQVGDLTNQQTDNCAGDTKQPVIWSKTDKGAWTVKTHKLIYRNIVTLKSLAWGNTVSDRSSNKRGYRKILCEGR